MRLLLVEDDTMIGETVLHVLRAEHYAVDWVKDGNMADEALRSAQYDLVLLDLGLPRRDQAPELRPDDLGQADRVGGDDRNLHRQRLLDHHRQRVAVAVGGDHAWHRQHRRALELGPHRGWRQAADAA